MKNILLSIRKLYHNFIDHRIHLLIGIAAIDLLVIGLVILSICGIVKFLTDSNKTTQEKSIPIIMQGDKNHDS